jgi:hypothetical protein
MVVKNLSSSNLLRSNKIYIEYYRMIQYITLMLCRGYQSYVVQVQRSDWRGFCLASAKRLLPNLLYLSLYTVKLEWGEPKSQHVTLANTQECKSEQAFAFCLVIMTFKLVSWRGTLLFSSESPINDFRLFN